MDYLKMKTKLIKQQKPIDIPQKYHECYDNQYTAELEKRFSLPETIKYIFYQINYEKCFILPNLLTVTPSKPLKVHLFN